MVEHGQFRGIGSTELVQKPAIKPENPRFSRFKIAVKVFGPPLVLLAIAAACNVEEERQDSSTTWTGMLAETESDCVIPEGCGAKYQLLDEELDDTIPLEGNLKEEDDELIVRVEGERPLNPIKVESYEVLSSIPYHDFLVDASRKYAQEHFPCLVEVRGDRVITKWNKSFSWELKEDQPIIKVRLTDISSAESPQPFVELSYDGNKGGEPLDEVRQPADLEPCP